MKKRNQGILLVVIVVLIVAGGLLVASSAGLMGSVNLNRAANRAELAKSLAVIVRANDNRDVDFDDYKGCFEDAEGEWFEGYVCYLFDRGIIAGFAGGSFRPNTLVTRAEAAVVFFDAYETAGGEVLPIPGGVPYSDVDEQSWYYPSVVQIAKLWIPDVAGWMGKKFKPASNLTLGQLKNWSRNLDRVLR